MSARRKTRKRNRQSVRYARSYVGHDLDNFTVGWAVEARLGGQTPAAYRAMVAACPWCKRFRPHEPNDCPAKLARAAKLRPRMPALADWLLYGEPGSTPPPYEYQPPSMHLLAGGMTGSGKTGPVLTRI